jgi:hypothetical protein
MKKSMLKIGKGLSAIKRLRIRKGLIQAMGRDPSLASSLGARIENDWEQKKRNKLTRLLTVGSWKCSREQTKRLFDDNLCVNTITVRPSLYRLQYIRIVD